MKVAILLCLSGVLLAGFYVGANSPAPQYQTFTKAKEPLTLDFGDAVIMPTGISPYYVVAVDLNKDGYLDLATSNTVSHTITVFMNRRDGTFAPGVSYPTKGLTPYALAAGDIDGDGYPDLICGNMFSMNLSVFINKGDGTFKDVQNLKGDAGPMFTALADFDNDGKLDVATCNIGHDDVTVLLNRGNMNFEKKGPFKCNGVIPYSVVAADFNRDGKIDLATGNIYSSNVSVLMNKGNGEFAEAVTYHTDSLTQILYAADFNGDGFPDIVSGNGGSDNVSVLINDRHGRFLKPVNYPVKLPQGVTAGDINRDGFIDIATANQSANTTSVLLNKGDGTFAKAIDFPVGGLYPTSVVIADLNNDGLPDLATANSGSNNISILYNGTHIPAVKEISSYSSGGVLLRASKLLSPITALFNTPLNPDTVNSKNIAVFGSQSGLHPASIVTRGNSQSLELIPEKETSGTADHFFAGEEINVEFGTHLRSARGLWMQKGYSALMFARPERGSGSLEPVMDLDAGYLAERITSGDLDRDGKVDLIAVGKNGAGVSLYFGTQDGTFSEPVVLNSRGYGASDAALADFRRDGYLDIAVLNRMTSTVSVFHNLGHRQFETAQNFSIGALPVGLVAGDFDGDGYPDLVAADKATQEITLFRNQQNGSFAKSFSIGLANSPSQVVASDFDRDGLVDLMILSKAAGRVSLLRNNGDGTFTKRDDIVVGPEAVQTFLVRDVNLDGLPDILTLSSDRRAISVYYNNGDGTFGAPHLITLDFEPTDMILADFSAGGRPDLLVLGKSGLHLFFNRRDQFVAGPVVPIDRPATPVAAELTGRGAIDLVVSSGTHFRLLRNQPAALPQTVSSR